MELETPLPLVRSPIESLQSLSNLAQRLHQVLALARDAATCNQASMDVIEQASAATGASGFAIVTKQLSNSNENLGGHVAQTLHAIETAIKAISEFSDCVEAFEDDFNHLYENIETIKYLTEQIGVIARQSKLLSINARIEAARADEAGAGFSVVADEVGNLAHTTQNLSTRISGDVDTVRKALESVSSKFSSSRTSLGHAHEAIQELDETAHGIEQETNNLKNVTNDVEQIAYKQVEIQSFLERIEHHGEWVMQSTTALVGQLTTVSNEADEAWKQFLPPGQLKAAASLQTFEDGFHRALEIDDPATAGRLVGKALENELAPTDLLNRISSAANRTFLDRVGQELPTEVYFRNTRILEEAIDRLEPLLDSRDTEGQPVVVLGNAFEDYHDLGRRIIAFSMRAVGFKVVDLGLSVSNETFIKEARLADANVIGVSSLLLHTAKWIPKLKEALRTKGMQHIKVIVGGAPFLVNPNLRDLYGADGVGRSPDDAIRLVKSIYSQQKAEARS